MKHLVASALLTMLLANAQAAGPVFFGVSGSDDCGKWVTNRSNSAKAWLLGYLSGINYVTASSNVDPLDQISSAEQAFVWMDNYCKADPLSNLNKGANQLYSELLRKATKK